MISTQSQRKSLWTAVAVLAALVVGTLTACTRSHTSPRPSPNQSSGGPSNLVAIGEFEVPATSGSLTARVRMGPAQIGGVPDGPNACNDGGPSTFLAIPGELDLTTTGATGDLKTAPFVGLSSAGSDGLFLSTNSKTSLARQVALYLNDHWQCGTAGPSLDTVTVAPGATLPIPMWLFAYGDSIKASMDPAEVSNWILGFAASIPGARSSGIDGMANEVSGSGAVKCSGSNGETAYGLLIYGTTPPTFVDPRGNRFSCTRA